ncbi:MAG: MaoC family dehydratase [Henriciella sp.]|jgi:acyl dehydratase|nr:MaoC family dehydratase [Henriciella sp.]
MADPKVVQYADLESLVGQELGPSDWFTVDQDRINTFADATGDHQWIHVNEEMAGKMLGSTIAHGYLTLSLLPMFGPQVLRVDGVSRGINYGANSVRFTNMVPVNSKLRMRQTVKEVNEKAGGKQMISTCTIEIEGQERPACIAEAITILYG